ncbi:glycosyltransferase family 4 protein [Halogeometricum sp. CBA1124]|uniref:glycosyltransferase family 4 protein n=1 Tax=Halogeometricum sp. CBA1124 TaxID=2668071 RepID=UPI0018D20E71|nr:glycosyltransferase family 4 protein [Halogeometricum sp. CBA1124]
MTPAHSTRQNVGIVVQDNYPLDRDVRTRKMAKSLTGAGETVSIFARNSLDDPDLGAIRDEHPPRSEDIGYAQVYRFSWLLSTWLFPLVTAKLPVNPFWMLWLAFRFRDADLDAVVACDVRAALPAIAAAKLNGLPVVLDLRENFAELARIKPVESPLDHLALNVPLVSAIERLSVGLADHVWVVTRERKDALVADGFSPSKLSVVSNTPLRSEIEEFADRVDDETTRFDWSAFTLVYVGSINRFRGLDLILEGVAHANRGEGEPVHLAVAGDGPDRERLERLSEELGIEDEVHFVGWIDPEAVPSFLDAGDVGVIPHVVNRYTNQTVPNKLFDYMMAGLPVLTTPADPIACVVRTVGCGRVLPPNADGAATAAVVTEMRDAELRRRWAQNGRDAVEESYSWETDASRFGRRCATDSVLRANETRACSGRRVTDRLRRLSAVDSKALGPSSNPMASQRRMRVVRMQTAWMLAVVGLLVVTESLSLDLFFLFSVVGLLLVTELTTSFSLTPDWRRRLRWVLAAAVVASAYLVANRILAILPGGML